jgi:hypothetical protein
VTLLGDRSQRRVGSWSMRSRKGDSKPAMSEASWRIERAP